MIGESVTHLDNVRITTFSSLVVDLARDVGADFIVKGLRVVSDFEAELIMAQMNRTVSGVDTLFIPSDPSHSFLASKLIREIARFGGDVSSMVPPSVAKRLDDRFGAKSSGKP
jgi:pantetheine-phosphate adenylyltransferase